MRPESVTRYRASAAGGVNMDKKNEEHWIYCPICRAKTRTKVQQDTVLLNFPLYCPKCGKTTRIDVINLKLVVNEDSDSESAK